MANIKPTVKIPKKLGAVVDLYQATILERLALKKQVDQLAVNEAVLKQHLIEKIPTNDSNGIMGSTHLAKVISKEVPFIADDRKFFKYVRENDAFHLVKKALSPNAVMETLEEIRTAPGRGKKKGIPGIDTMYAKSISLTKA